MKTHTKTIVLFLIGLAIASFFAVYYYLKCQTKTDSVSFNNASDNDLISIMDSVWTQLDADTNKLAWFGTHFAPIHNEIRDSLIQAAGRAFSASKPIYFVRAKIPAKQLMDFINYTNADRPGYGLRVYPYYSNDSLGFIIASSSSADDKFEVHYFFLNKLDNSYISSNLKTKEESKVYIKNYFSNVKIYGAAQMKLNDFHKCSKFYYSSEILSYLQANRYYDVGVDQGDYKFEFITGYATSNLSPWLKLMDLSDGSLTALDYMGYSPIIRLSIKGVNVDDGDQGDFPGYYNSVIEIGRPCPPRCNGSGIKKSDVF